MALNPKGPVAERAAGLSRAEAAIKAAKLVSKRREESFLHLAADAHRDGLLAPLNVDEAWDHWREAIRGVERARDARREAMRGSPGPIVHDDPTRDFQLRVSVLIHWVVLQDQLELRPIPARGSGQMVNAWNWLDTADPRGGDEGRWKPLHNFTTDWGSIPVLLTAAADSFGHRVSLWQEDDGTWGASVYGASLGDMEMGTALGQLHGPQAAAMAVLDAIGWTEAAIRSGLAVTGPAPAAAIGWLVPIQQGPEARSGIA